MDAKQFVDIIRTTVMNSAVDEIVATLLQPPGRRPDQDIVDLSKWYLSMDARDREMLERAFAEVSHAAVFGLLAILDGVRRVDNEQPPGILELWYVGHEGRVKLNGDLHDVLNSESWHR